MKVRLSFGAFSGSWLGTTEDALTGLPTLSTITHHVLRHTFCTNMQQAGEKLDALVNSYGVSSFL